MADNKTTATQKINQKWQALKNGGLDLGNSRTEVLSAGYGGWFQEFELGNIYSHHQVGTYEVHGSILTAYLNRNAFGHNSNIGRRELGFPKGDQILTPDRRFAMSQFEWGQIIDVKEVWGSVSISGEIYEHWEASPVASRMFGLGYPINGNMKTADGEVVFFERGFMYYNKARNHTPISVPIEPPKMGNPAIVKPDQEELPILLPVYKRNFELIGGRDVISQLNSNRFFLQEVGTNSRIALYIKRDSDLVDVLNPGSSQTNSLELITNFSKPGNSVSAPEVPIGDLVSSKGSDGLSEQLTLNFSIEKGEVLKNRKLYDIVLKMDSGRYYPFSPHAIYSRSSWQDFGLIHATDIHVSRRVDGFRKKLEKAKDQYNRQDLDQGIEHLNNWNDGFRDLIRYANFLHKKGILDGIIATGDLVDYQFEKQDNREGGGNFEFLRQLILGKVKYQDTNLQHQELFVPIFTSLGNHDYRINPYRLFFGIAAGGEGPTLKTFSTYNKLNLTETEARAIQDGRPPKTTYVGSKREITKYGKPIISLTEASRMIETDDPTYYYKYFNSRASYLVSLEKHRLLMLDSGPDTGLPESRWDAILTAFGIANDEDKSAASSSSPNSQGLQPSDLYLTQIAQGEVGNDGLLFVGTHAPPINTKGTEYPHYFRETEHFTADENEVANYLRRHVPEYSSLFGTSQIHNDALVRSVKKKFKDWPLNRTRHFKTGDHENLLDWGVSRGPIQDFLKLCAGVKGTVKSLRPVDLILFGHVHNMVEMRLSWDDKKKELQYFHDFYTQNQGRYYSSKKYKGDIGGHFRAYIRIRAGTGPGGKLVKSRDRFWGEYQSLHIPPYGKSLNESDDPAHWWKQHRPLLVQGAPLGPSDNNQRRDKELNEQKPDPSFEGCKLLIVRKEVISKIMQISRAELKKVAWRIPRGISVPSGFDVASDVETIPDVNKKRDHRKSH